MKPEQRNRTRRLAFLSAVALSLLCASCATPESPGRYSMLGNAYPARPKDASVEVFQSDAPARPYTEIARLDVHLESTFFVKPLLQDAMPELLRQARLSGADAVINIRERNSVLNETHILHVTATGIKFKESP